MDRFHIPGSKGVQRSYPSGLPIRDILFSGGKTAEVDRVFVSTNFSIILRGTGFYVSPAGRFRVRAPCVIMQPVGLPVRYGPEGSWDELSLLYHADHMDALRQRGLYRDDRHAWYADDAPWFQERLGLLRELGQRLLQPGVIDRIDRLCELMIMTSLIQASQSTEATSDPAALATRRIRRLVEEHPLAEHDFGVLAAEHGITEATFRRRWNEIVGMPPVRYRARLRLARAAQLLIDPDRPVTEVASATGFDDPLYFSRAFRRQYGESPTRYRQRTISAFE